MEALRQYLQQRGITQAEFAEACQVSQPTVSDWLNGKQFPTTRRLKAIAEKTGIPVDRLLETGRAGMGY